MPTYMVLLGGNFLETHLLHKKNGYDFFDREWHFQTREVLIQDDVSGSIVYALLPK